MRASPLIWRFDNFGLLLGILLTLIEAARRGTIRSPNLSIVVARYVVVGIALKGMCKTTRRSSMDLQDYTWEAERSRQVACRALSQFELVV
jgi:hypothetical protein